MHPYEKVRVCAQAGLLMVVGTSFHGAPIIIYGAPITLLQIVEHLCYYYRIHHALLYDSCARVYE